MKGLLDYSRCSTWQSSPFDSQRQYFRVAHASILRLVILIIQFSAISASASKSNAQAQLRRFSDADLVFALESAISSLDSVQCRFRTYFSELAMPGVERNLEGLGLYSEFDWGWTRHRDRQFMYGRWGFSRDNSFFYRDHSMAYDGELLRTLNKSDRGGRIAELGDFFVVWASPLVLLGQNVVDSPLRNLVEVLKEQEHWNDSLDAVSDDSEAVPNDNLHLIQTSYLEGLEEYTLRVWIDVDHGFLPRRIETVKNFTQTVMLRIENEKIEEVAPDRWFPLRGKVTRYYIVPPENLPNGITAEKVRTMSEEAAKGALTNISWQTRKLGLGTQVFLIDESTLKINEPIPDSRFEFNFPSGTAIWNDIEQVGYIVGREDLGKFGAKNGGETVGINESPSSAGWRWPLVIVNAVVVVLVLILILRRR